MRLCIVLMFLFPVSAFAQRNSLADRGVESRASTNVGTIEVQKERRHVRDVKSVDTASVVLPGKNTGRLNKGKF